MCRQEAAWQEEKEEVWGIKSRKNEMEGGKGQLKDGKRMSKERKNKESEKVAAAIWCEKFCISQLGSLHKCLMSHFVKYSACFCFFPPNSLKYSGDSSTSKLNDMHLFPVSPNKVVTERFHALITSGLCKEKRTITLSVWVFQCVVFVVCFFFFLIICLAKLSLLSDIELSQLTPYFLNYVS